MNYSKQRELILNILKGTDAHPTAEWVYQEAKKVMPTIGIATVYRNLNALAEMGTCNKIKTLSGQDRFDGMTERHFHAECRCCGRLMDLKMVSEKAQENLMQMVAETFGEEGARYTLPTILLEGLCEDCKKSVRSM